jgi:hypothetical protein
MAPESGVLGMTTANSSPPYRAQKSVSRHSVAAIA